MAAKKKAPLDVQEAGKQYLHALCAKRDAIRLIEIGFAVGTQKYVKAIQAAQASLERDEAPSTGLLNDSIALVAMKEARDIIELYERDPQRYPDGQSAESALAAGMKIARGRYKKSRFSKEFKCTLCRGPALPCAVRHASGKSCA
jgi:hypothetical protein